MVHLDMPNLQGVSTASRDAGAVVRLRDTKSKKLQWARGREYHLFPWTGGGVAGTAHVLFSKRFLEELPAMIDAHGYDMVDAWLGNLCGYHPDVTEPLQCYSLIVRDLPGK